MKKALKLVAAAAAALSFGSANALNVAGVVWDPSSIFDFSATDTMIETIVTPAVGSTITGFAKITAINGETNQSAFCPGCEVTYQFSGYTVTNVDVTTGALTFTGGTINIYVDTSPDYSSTSFANAGADADTTLFLSLAGATHRDNATNLLGTLHSDPTPTTAGVEGDGRGFLNVTGGAAAAYFDGDTFAIDTDGDGANDGFADFLFTSSFQLIPGGTFTSDGITFGLFGTNDIQSQTQVPEPATLALTGLALLGLAASRRRKG